MPPNQTIVYAIPFFLLLIFLELLVGVTRKRVTYRLSDSLASLSIGILSQISAVFTRLLRVGIYIGIYQVVALWHNEAFWLSVPGWILAFVFYDFCYYWNHRLGHECALFWASHVVHHHGQDYNLATALRQTSTGAFFGWIFYVPMALAGVPPLVFGVVALINLLYQFWIHTEQIGRLGWFDRVFASPSNHRVHHAVNDAYVDKNYGGFFILWDRLFGTFKDEDAHDPCVYSTRTPLNSWDPVWANLEVFASLWRDSWHAQSWSDKLRVWFKPPGWRPADVALRFPKPAFDITKLKRYDPPLPRSAQVLAGLNFVFWLGPTLAFLWFVHTFTLLQTVIGFAAITVSLWSLSGVMQGRWRWLPALMMQTSAVLLGSTAFDWPSWHHYAVPLVMGMAVLVLATQAPAAPSMQTARRALWLAVCFGLLGDILLRFDATFLPGLVAFLLGHLAYLHCMRQDAALWPSKRALLLIVAVAAGVLAVLWVGGLPTAMRVPVAAYVLVIALMAGQAAGRALALRTVASALVAVGAVLFMISDSLIAYNRFVAPLSDRDLWVHATYYAAQCLMVLGLLRVQSSGTSPLR